MKFTKTAVAVAIAGIAAAPMIATADTTLSGDVQLQIKGSDADGDAGDAQIAAGDVLFGLVAEHELNSGLTGYGSLRFDYDALSNAGGSAVDAAGDAVKGGPSGDSVYVGVKGGFGDLRVGEIPLAVEYGQVANDIFDVGAEINGGISYTGSFGPVGLIANYSPAPNQDAMGVGVKFGMGGFNIGLGAEDRDELMNASAGVSFGYAGASIALHYWTMEAAAGADDLTSIAAKVGYDFGDVSAALTYATQTDDGAVDESAIRLDLGYGLGGGMEISTRITAGTDENDDNNDQTDWRIQLAKSF
ncbi:MAG: porin [Granulosicoccus sp.]